MAQNSLELDIWPQLGPLLETVQLFKASAYQVGNEVGWHYYEKQCLMSRDIKFHPIAIGPVTLKSPYAVVFALEYRMYPLKHNGFLISHRCGRGPKRKSLWKCIEPTHMHIASIGENNGRKVCHGLIEKDYENMKSKRTKAFRNGTWFLESCPHDPPCFMQWGKLQGNDMILDPVSNDVMSWY